MKVLLQLHGSAVDTEAGAVDPLDVLSDRLHDDGPALGRERRSRGGAREHGLRRDRGPVLLGSQRDGRAVRGQALHCDVETAS